ncbi:MAG: hydrogenase iron-sulfur subunit [Chloroflexota bacterium]|nr:hydrogenase iron-sulfur subunit [Chloroflexota bacterium]
MSTPVTQEAVGVRQDVDRCSSCCVCSTLCPYEALKKDTAGKITLDIARCQVCGLCYSTCPAKAIDTVYYDVDSLTGYLENARRESGSDTLVIMCKGSAPDSAKVQEMFGVSQFATLSVPCVGRVPEEIFLKAILMGFNEIDVLACEEDYCRFVRGSPVTSRKVAGLNAVLEQLGWGKVINLKKNSLKVKATSELCIACGNCVYYCPYHAAKLNSPGVISFDLSLCRGCGLCTAMCPALALDLENWERERISTLISQHVIDMTSPRILVFRCQWAVFPSLNGQSPASNIRFIDLPCASRVDTFHILEAFQKGVEGVMIAACSEDDCKQEKASGKAQRSVAKLQARLGQIGFQDKLYFCTVAPRYPDRFIKELEQFSQKICQANKKEAT